MKEGNGGRNTTAKLNALNSRLHLFDLLACVYIYTPSNGSSCFTCKRKSHMGAASFKEFKQGKSQKLWLDVLSK